MIFQQLSIALGVISLIGFFASSGKQKKISAFLMGLSLLLGIFSFSPWDPYSTSQPTDRQKAEPIPPAKSISTERVVVSGSKIILMGDGTYRLPPGRKSLCLTNLGLKDGTSYVNQDLILNGVEYVFSGTQCKDIPEQLQGEVEIDFFPGKEYGTPQGFRKLYSYWRSQPGGQAEWPVIRIGE